MAKLRELNESYPEWKLDSVIEMINDIPAAIMDIIKTTIPKLIPTLYNTSLSLISLVVNLLISIMVSVYMLLDKAKLINNIKRIVFVALMPEMAAKLIETD